MVSGKEQGQKSHCAGVTAAGQDCRRLVGPEECCHQHQRKTPAAGEYAGLDFKEMLAACPLEGVDLSRSRELARDVALLG